jgi:hypothetical protein
MIVSHSGEFKVIYPGEIAATRSGCQRQPCASTEVDAEIIVLSAVAVAKGFDPFNPPRAAPNSQLSEASLAGSDVGWAGCSISRASWMIS